MVHNTFRIRKTNNLKVTRNLRENSLWTTWRVGGRGEYFHETFVRHHSNPSKYVIFIVFLWFLRIFIINHEKFSRRLLRVTFKLFVFILILNVLWEVFPFKCNECFQFFDCDYSTMKLSTLEYCNLNTYETNTWHLSGREATRHCNGRIFQLTKYRRKQIEDKIHCTASKLDETWLKSSLMSHLSLCESTTTGWCLRDATIKSKQDGKTWLLSCFRGG
jgi:hypothetical protein